ncbi:MAG: M23 family metallopeptidase [Acetatifactor sp.]|nr:M23 family metallopeptidase [Acetatifactor sp.]
METRKHKRKAHHVVIFTSDAVGAGVKQFRIKPWIARVIIAVLCTVIGGLIGVLSYEEQLWETVRAHNIEQQDKITELEDTISELQTEIEDKEDKIQYLSDTVNQKVASEEELVAVIEGQSTPTGFPLTGSASMEMFPESDNLCVFTASDGTTVIATASGTVTTVGTDETYGNVIQIDHGNGYVTVYKNKGEAMVKEGDEVVQGTTLFIIDGNNSQLGYQVILEGEYIDPMEILQIAG